MTKYFKPLLVIILISFTLLSSGCATLDKISKTLTSWFSGIEEPVEAKAADESKPAEEPKDKFLETASKLEVGSNLLLDDKIVIVTNEYYAASGRRCRVFEIYSDDQIGKIERRFICTENGTWYYYPGVFLNIVK